MTLVRMLYAVIAAAIDGVERVYWGMTKEGANKSVMFSAAIRMARYAKASAAKCLDLFKLADKVD
ncbi:hypothetical protein Q4488_16610, partial [Amphritea sp. 1_MG-2023]|uniref:hypothetical protein n=1 Tax=Amphritea sp. 1_MG-2023 TaxID=3062670 RepID=UPI0026E3DEB5